MSTYRPTTVRLISPKGNDWVLVRMIQLPMPLWSLIKVAELDVTLDGGTSGVGGSFELPLCVVLQRDKEIDGVDIGILELFKVRFDLRRAGFERVDQEVLSGFRGRPGLEGLHLGHGQPKILLF